MHQAYRYCARESVREGYALLCRFEKRHKSRPSREWKTIFPITKGLNRSVVMATRDARRANIIRRYPVRVSLFRYLLPAQISRGRFAGSLFSRANTRETRTFISSKDPALYFSFIFIPWTQNHIPSSPIEEGNVGFAFPLSRFQIDRRVSTQLENATSPKYLVNELTSLVSTYN